MKFFKILAFLFLIKIANSQTFNLLDIDTGAREKSLANSLNSSEDSVNTLFYNPAGLGNLKYFNFSVNYVSLFSELSYNSLAFSLPLKIGSIGFGVNSINLNQFNEITYGQKTENILIFKNFILSAGYGFKLVGKYSFGLTTKYFNSEIGGTKGNSFLFDIGAIIGDEILKFYDKIENNLKFGISIKNFGTELKFINKTEKLPTKLCLGLSYKPFNFITFTPEFNSYLYDDFLKRNIYKIGIELFPDFNINFGLGFEINKNRTIFNFGLGIGSEILKNNFKFNIAYSGNSELGNSLYFTLNIFKQAPVLYRKEMQIKIIQMLNLPKTKKFFTFNYEKESLPISIENLTTSDELKEISETFYTEIINLIKTNKNFTISEKPVCLLKYYIEKKEEKNFMHFFIFNNIENVELKKYKINLKDSIDFKKISESIVKLLNEKYLDNFYTKLTINSQPSDASFFLNDKFIGKTPITIENILIGNYKIKIEKSKNDYIIDEVKVKSQTENKFFYNLEKSFEIPEIYNIKLRTKTEEASLKDYLEIFKILFKEKSEYFKDYINLSDENSHLIVDLNFSRYGENYKVNVTISDILQKKVDNIKFEKIFKTDNELTSIVDYTLNFIIEYILEMRKKFPIKKNYAFLEGNTFPDGLKFSLNNKTYISPCIISNLSSQSYEISILDENKILYSGEIFLKEKFTNYFNFIKYYRDDFSKISKKFWEEIYYSFEHQGLAVKKIKENNGSYYIKLKSDIPEEDLKEKISFGLISKEFVVTPIDFRIKFKAVNIKKGEFYFGVIDDDKQNLFIKFNNKCYIFYKSEKEELKKVKIITPFKDENEKFHTLRILYNNNIAEGFVDDIKIDEIKINLNNRIKFYIIAESYSGKIEIDIKDFLAKQVFAF